MKITVREMIRLQAMQSSTERRTVTPKDVRRAAAYHEAAHAVVGVRCGLQLTEISIEQIVALSPTGVPGISNGRFKYDVPRLEAKVGRVEGLLRRMLAAAAPVSMERDQGNDVQNVCQDDLSGMLRYACELDLPKDQQQDMLDWAETCADSILKCDHGRAWRTVAEALLKQKFLSPSRVSNIVRDSDEITRRLVARGHHKRRLKR